MSLFDRTEIDARQHRCAEAELRVNNSSRAYAHSVKVSNEEREKDDFYPTPVSSTKALLAKEQFGKFVWEPACGDGAISMVLIERGHNVISTDLVDRGFGEPRVDFLLEHKLLAPEIITNPPFKLGEKFVRHALDLGATKIAMFLRLAWLEGIERLKLFRETPIARVHVSSRRAQMKRGGTDDGGGGGSMIAFAWFVWDVHHEGAAQIDWHDWRETK